MAFTGEGRNEWLERYRVLGMKIGVHGTMLIRQPLRAMRAMRAMKKRTRFTQQKRKKRISATDGK